MFNEENTVEQMLISVAQKCGWTYVEAKDIPRATDSVLVESWLQEALIRLNKITAAQASQVIYKLRAAIMSGSAPDELIQANDRFRKLLFEENSEPFGKNGDNLNIRFFSENPSENYCVVTNQWEFPRQSIDGGKRLDLVFIINGIPMVIGTAGGSGATPHLERDVQLIKLLGPMALTILWHTKRVFRRCLCRMYWYSHRRAKSCNMEASVCLLTSGDLGLLTRSVVTAHCWMWSITSRI